MSEALTEEKTDPPVTAEGKTLHSRYNPRGEAERYVNSLSLRDDTRYFILIEPGLGYCVPPLRKRFPLAKIIVLHLSGSFPRTGEDASWSPGNGMPVQRFLEEEISGAGAEKIKIVEWRPALGVFGESYLRLLGECAEFIRRLDAGERTLRQFGKRWFRNFLKNTGLIRKTFSLSPLPGPLVITGAGPGLEDSIPFIKKRRGEIFVLAVSSSVAALEAAGIVPDLILSTDGGNWALPHLYESLRRTPEGPAPLLAASLNAALPSQCAALPILPVNDGSLWQRLVLEGLGIPSLSLPQRGTVGAAAVDLAFSLCRGNVFITGMDLARRDIRTHARPYAFDRLWEEKACRFTPVYHQLFTRSGEIAAGGSQAIYAAWFKQQLLSWPKRLYSLGTNNAVFKDTEVPADFFPPPETGIRAGGEEFKKPAIREIPLALPGDPRSGAVEILLRALGETPFRARLREELGPLLCPGGETAPDEELAAEIRRRGTHG